MSFEVQDVLKINLVLVGIQLLGKPEERSVFGDSVGTEISEVVGSGVTSSAGPSGYSAPVPALEQPRALILDKERIKLELFPDRSTISRDYPQRSDIDRLAEVTGLAIGSSELGDQQLRAFGFNIEVAWESTSGESALEFISTRVFAPDLFRDSEYRLIGGSPRLQLLLDDMLWNVAIEPRFGDPESNRIFVSMNLHREESEIPTEPDIRDSLAQVWNHAHAFLVSVSRSI